MLAGRLVLAPRSEPPAAQDFLWKRTCGELFLGVPGDPSYLEFNFSPSGDWAAYAFDGYRTGVRNHDWIGQTPEVRILPGEGATRLLATVPHAALRSLWRKDSALTWQAGITMTIVSLGFLYFRHRIGSSLVTADQERLEIQSEVGESVDETISGYSILAGLRIKPWQRKRFLAKSLELEHASHRQGVIINRLLLAAHANALIGLVAVVVFALAIGMDEDDLAVVAAALLYVEGAVRGLEALPPWIRDVQRANVTMRRIDQVLDTPDQSDSSTPVLDVANTSGLTFTDVDTRLPAGGRLVIPTLTLPTTGLVGLVTTAGVDATDLLALMSGNAPFDRGSIALNGRDLRDLESGRDVLAVPAETETLEATPAELFSAVAPALHSA